MDSPSRSSDYMSEAPGSAAASLCSEATVASTSDAPEGFIRHKVVKTDTLAGIAIRYHCSVSDLKRANGLLSDTAMWAREHILIPTKELPIGQDAQVLFARLLSGYGRDASLNAAERKAPGTLSVVQMPGSPGGTAQQRSPHFLPDDGEPGSPYSNRSTRSSEPGDVELMERTLADSGAWGSDRVRRRNRASDGQRGDGPSLGGAGGGIGEALGSAGQWLAGAAGQAGQALNGMSSSYLASVGGASGSSRLSRGSFSSSSDAAGGAWGQISQLGSAITQSSLVQKIKRVASQPALGTPGNSSSFADMADALVRGPSATGESLARLLPPVAPRKEAKAD